MRGKRAFQARPSVYGDGPNIRPVLLKLSRPLITQSLALVV